MLLGEPGRTNYDLHFRLLGIPIRIHPGFWIVAALLGFGSGDNAPETILAFIAAVLISIVIHELGHALMFRRYRIRSHIVLYHFGGLAVPDSLDHMTGVGRSSRWQQLAVSAAGPAAQLLLAVVVVAALRLGGFTDGLVSNYMPREYTADPLRTAFDFLEPARRSEALILAETKENAEPDGVQRYAILLEKLTGIPQRQVRALKACDLDGDGRVGEFVIEGQYVSVSGELQHLPQSYGLANPLARRFVVFLLFVSIFWAILNLMPVYPLDGGQISRELFLLSGIRAPVEKSLLLSVATGVLIGLWAMSTRQSMAGLMFLMLAWSSYQLLEQYRRMGGGGGYGRW